MRILLLIIILIFSVTTHLASPGAHGPDGEHLTEEGNKKGGIGRQADGSVLIPMPHQAKLGIRTQFATESTTRRKERLDGIVHPHPDGHAVIQSSSDGRLQSNNGGLAISGTSVNAGDILGYVQYQDSAYDFAAQTSELLTVRNEINQTRRDVQRLEDLGDLSSKQSLEQLKTKLDSLIQTEEVLQVSLEKPEPLIAPISGVLINHGVSVGQWVVAGTTLFEIVADDKRLINAVSAKTELLGKLSTAYIHDREDVLLTYEGFSPRLSSGLISHQFVLESQESPVQLLVGQPIEILAEVDEPLTGIILPASSVVNDANNLPVVWIKCTAERFIPQQVQFEKLSAKRVIVTNGLGSDNRVVVDGASLLNQIR